MKKFFYGLFLFILLWHTPHPTLGKEETPLKITATFSILGDLIKNVGKDEVEVTSVVGPNSDTHVYEPTPKDIQNLTLADLVFMNGLFFEGWMDRLIDPKDIGKRVIIVSTHITPRTHAHQNCTHNTHPDAIDPHAWHSIPNVITYVHEIERALSAHRPDSKTFFQENAKAYIQKLTTLHHKLQDRFAQIPENKRLAVSTHDGFGYLGETYGIRFISPLGLSTEAEASAKSLAQVIDTIKTLKVPLVFVENITSTRLMQQLCEETGTQLGPTLYSDALSPKEGPAGSYLDMMDHNTSHLLRSMTL